MQKLARWNERMITLNRNYNYYILSIIYLWIFVFSTRTMEIVAFNYLPVRRQHRRATDIHQKNTFITIHKSAEQNDNNEIDNENPITLAPFNLFPTTNSPRTWKQRKSSESVEQSQNSNLKQQSQRSRQEVLNRQQQQQTQRPPFPFPSIPESIQFPFPPNPFQNTERIQKENQFQSTASTTTTRTTIPLDRSISSLRRQRQNQQQQQRIVDNNEGTSKKRKRRREKTMPMPVRGYDATAIEEYYDYRPFEVGWRLNSLGLPLLGMYKYCFRVFYRNKIHLSVATVCHWSKNVTFFVIVCHQT
jgi:hypothetical protein